MNDYKLMAYAAGGEQNQWNGFTKWLLLVVWIHAYGQGMWATFSEN